jgi:predicted nucleotidyltransferase
MMYAPYASSDFNNRFDQALRRLAADVKNTLRDNLVALILGGGYGRGEGAVVHRDGDEQPYNDVDLAIVVRDASTIDRDGLARIEHTYADELKVHVDFSRPLTVRDIKKWSCCLMWQDLVQRHVVLEGPQDLLEANAPPVIYQPLPVIEATRLLLNRGAGLLWAWRVLRGCEPLPDEDFIRRNYYKAALALGDALLIAHERFTTQYRGRDQIFRQLCHDCVEVAALELDTVYDNALRFKLFPDDLPADQPTEADLKALAQSFGKVLLWVENRRVGRRKWNDLNDYVCSARLRESSQHRLPRLPRNLVLNARNGSLSWRYPREVLYRELPMLLGLTLRRYADDEWARSSERFLRIWKRCN